MLRSSLDFRCGPYSLAPEVSHIMIAGQKTILLGLRWTFLRLHYLLYIRCLRYVRLFNCHHTGNIRTIQGDVTEVLH